MIRNFLVILMIGLFAATPALANEEGASSFVNDTATKAINVLSSDKSETAKLGDLEALFRSSVDVNWVGQFVMGRNWRSLEDEQKVAYLKNYEKFLIKHYTANFKEYTKGTTFKINQSRPLQRKGQYLVTMSIQQSGAPQPIMVDYRVRESENKYSVIDIVVEGVSLLNTQRAEFSSVVQRKGADYLIKQLANRAAK